MQVVKTIAEARAARAAFPTLVLVPTMGALHAGHVSLMEAAKAHGAAVAVSIFVNPTQFGPSEDFSRYPRALEADLEKCGKSGVALAFCPSAGEMYPPAPRSAQPSPLINQRAAADAPYDLSIDIPSLTSLLEGKHRPGHFKGVLQVVAKLFNILVPTAAVFGQKDFQQLRVIGAMVDALNLPVKVVAAPTLRDEDGLAMSSRNQYLSAEERKKALSIPRALFHAEAEFKAGAVQANRLITSMQRILLEQHLSIDYIAAVDPQTLTPVDRVGAPTVLAIAARVGATRLIDNLIVGG